ncbi:MAG: glycoside hydrolase family 125 protein [Bacteroidales bacterium]|nr:glycoside hydrolase family 125 protein [Bacteroidales bacterium]
MASSIAKILFIESTRDLILSNDNPWYFIGKYAEGIGSPHTGIDRIWPIAITMRALTSTDDDEIVQCIRMLKKTHAGTGFMHEAFDGDDPYRFSRKWFAWANTLFGELIYETYNRKPELLKTV